jgi:alpha-beta hydrolase superfamily lysophospholipase
MTTNQQFTVRGAGGAELFAQCWLPAPSPRGLVVLVHGFGEHSDRYSNLVTALINGGYAIYAFDQRGHGRSPGKRGHTDRFSDFIEDVQQVVSRSQADHPNLPLFLFGHSVGGLVVLQYALLHPQGLAGVIASAPLLAKPNISPLVLTIAGLLSRFAPTFALDTRLDPTTISRDPAEVQRYKSDPLVHSKTSARAGAEGMAALEWVQAHASELRVPLLLYHGAGDTLVPIKGSRSFFANAGSADKTFRELPGVFHESHNDLEREALFQIIVAWLDEHAR